MDTDFLIGLDLGQAQDYTALTVLERHKKERPAVYHLRHLERFKLGTPYPDQVARVQAIANRLPLRDKSQLIVDGTGAGRPVVDMFHAARIPHLPIISIYITGGNLVTEEGRIYKVPKRDLVGVLQVLLQSGRLKVAENLRDGDLLVQELLNFKVKISTTAHDSYEAWREGDHDDLVLSTAMACWYGERKPSVDMSGFQSSGKRELSRGMAGYGGMCGGGFSGFG